MHLPFPTRSSTMFYECMFICLFLFFFFREGQFWAQKGLGPLEKSLEMPHYMFFREKKFKLRTFKINGTLIVNPVMFDRLNKGLKLPLLQEENSLKFL
jgi:hypothetical protein